MNILTRIKNNLEYARCARLRDKALREMRKHQNDADDKLYRYWAMIHMQNFCKCVEIPIK